MGRRNGLEKKGGALTDHRSQSYVLVFVSLVSELAWASTASTAMTICCVEHGLLIPRCRCRRFHKLPTPPASLWTVTVRAEYTLPKYHTI